MKTKILLLLLLACQQLFSQNRDSILLVANSGRKDTNTVKALRALAGISDATKTREALTSGFKGAELGKNLNWPKGVAGCYLNISVQYGFLGKFDSSLFYQDSAIKYAHLAGDPNRLALVYLNKADTYMQLKVFEKTLTLCDTAMQYAEEANSNDRRARIFQTYGSVYFYQQVYEKALFYYKKANELYLSIGNENMQGIVFCNIGNIYDNMVSYDSAVIHYTKAIEIGERLKDYNQLPLYYGSMGETLFNSKNFERAFMYCKKALDIAIQQEQVQHITISYIRLAELFGKQKDYKRSVAYALTGYKTAKEDENISNQQTAAGLLAEGYSGLDDYKNAFFYMQVNKSLSDSLNKTQFDEAIVSRQTVFEVSQKESQIKLLSNEKDLQKKEIERKQLFIALLTVAFIASGLMGFVLWNRYKLKQQLKEVEIRNKIASDLHDDVGSTLSSIRMYSDIVKKQPNQTSISSELLDKISSNSKDMIENMSDIVWMIKPGNDEFKNIENRMLNFANELCAPAGINFEFNKDAATDALQISMEHRRDIYLIFKEAINNAVKYSGCHSIRADITLQHRNLQMRISDDGDGFDTTAATNGNGLSNMQKRAAAHKGIFTINSATDEGTEIVVSFPV